MDMDALRVTRVSDPRVATGTPTARTRRRGHLVALAVLLVVAQVLPPADAISWLMLRHAPVTDWRASSCRSGGRWGMTPRQVALCRSALEAMPHLAKAAQLAVTTCGQVFADRRWNCSSLESAPRLGPDLYAGTREQAYVYALSSAAATYAVARACAQGALPHCSCAGPPRDPPNGNFKWGGCGDNVRYGALLARQFADAAERGARGAAAADAAEAEVVADEDAEAEAFGAGRRRHWGRTPPPPSVTSSKRRKSVDEERNGRRRRLGRARGGHVALVNIHNNRAGRRAVESSEMTQCKCHGVSGSCNIKTCWRALPRLADIGLRLQRRFAAAVEVVSRRSLPHGSGVGRRLVAAPLPLAAGGGAALPALPTASSRSFSQDDLVFLTKSPDYCLPDPRTGSLGTRGRACNASSDGFDSCQDMCCGRGYRTVTVEKVERCQCKYYWCCYVRCKTCTSWVDIHECL